MNSYCVTLTIVFNGNYAIKVGCANVFLRAKDCDIFFN